MDTRTAWALVFHMIGFVFWIGGLLAATQALAAHVRSSSDDARAALGHLEFRLLNGVAHPGAVIAVISGVVLLLLNPGYLHQRWLQAKLLLVLILIIVDVYAYSRMKAQQAGRVELEFRHPSLFHGAISLLFLAIIVLAILRP